MQITKTAHACGHPLGMDDIMLASVESAESGGEVTLLVAILTMWREEFLVTGEPVSSHLPRSQRLQAPLAKGEHPVTCHPLQS